MNIVTFNLSSTDSLRRMNSSSDMKVSSILKIIDCSPKFSQSYVQDEVCP